MEPWTVGIVTELALEMQNVPLNIAFKFHSDISLFRGVVVRYCIFFIALGKWHGGSGWLFDLLSHRVLSQIMHFSVHFAFGFDCVKWENPLASPETIPATPLLQFNNF